MEALFGSAIRTDVLVAVARLGRTYASELARVLDRRVIEVQRALASLERAGVIVTVRVGTIRSVEMSSRFPAKDELYSLLLTMSELPRYRDRWLVRRRPRAMSKT